MHKRRLIALAIALMLTFVTTAMWSASTIVREGDADANFLEDSGTTVGVEEAPNTEKKKGNKVARIFTAPFRALGKLFGKNDNKLQRMSEKDAEKFESIGVLRVSDERTREAMENRAQTAREHLAAGRDYLNQGRLNEAISQLSTATSLDPRLGEAHNLLGVAFAQKGLAERAKDSYERAVKAEPEDAQVLNNLGYTLYENGNYRAAVDRLKRAVKLAPRDDRILNNLGLALCRLGKFEDAYKSFARANGELTGHLNMARMLERFGREDDAIKYYEGARRIDPHSTFALKRLANLYQRIGKTEESKNTRNALAAISAETNMVLSGK
ncbi:MAG: tetratricopeptide repeat protein [Acidobacteriota bacterium]|nr:tetratricopeptide repeat protein [Acidobacteriota bacterium]